MLERELGVNLQLWSDFLISRSEPSSYLAPFRCPVLTLTPSYCSAVSSALVGSCIRSLSEEVGVDRRTTLLRLGLVWTAQHPHVTPATTLSARICIRPVLSPFLYFPYAGLTYPILLDSRISLVALHTTHLFFGFAGLRFLRPLCAAFCDQATASQPCAFANATSSLRCAHWSAASVLDIVQRHCFATDTARLPWSDAGHAEPNPEPLYHSLLYLPYFSFPPRLRIRCVHTRPRSRSLDKPLSFLGVYTTVWKGTKIFTRTARENHDFRL